MAAGARWSSEFDAEADGWGRLVEWGDELFEVAMVEMPSGHGCACWFGTEGLVGVGDVVFGALTFDVVGGVAPSVEYGGLVGGSTEVAEVVGRIDDVGVDELFDTRVDGALCTWELVEFVAVFRDVLLVLLVLGACSCERVVESVEARVEVAGLVSEHDSARASVFAVAPSTLGLDVVEVAASVGESLGDVVALGGERADLVGA
jgi:hypothetical protein